MIYSSDLETGDPVYFTVKTGTTSVPGLKTRSINATGTQSELANPFIYQAIADIGTADCDIVIG